MKLNGPRSFWGVAILSLLNNRDEVPRVGVRSNALSGPGVETKSFEAPTLEAIGVLKSALADLEFSPRKYKDLIMRFWIVINNEYEKFNYNTAIQMEDKRRTVVLTVRWWVWQAI